MTGRRAGSRAAGYASGGAAGRAAACALACLAAGLPPGARADGATPAVDPARVVDRALGARALWRCAALADLDPLLGMMAPLYAERGRERMAEVLATLAPLDWDERAALRLPGAAGPHATFLSDVTRAGEWIDGGMGTEFALGSLFGRVARDTQADHFEAALDSETITAEAIFEHLDRAAPDAFDAAGCGALLAP